MNVSDSADIAFCISRGLGTITVVSHCLLNLNMQFHICLNEQLHFNKILIKTAWLLYAVFWLCIFIFSPFTVVCLATAFTLLENVIVLNFTLPCCELSWHIRWNVWRTSRKLWKVNGWTFRKNIFITKDFYLKPLDLENTDNICKAFKYTCTLIICCPDVVQFTGSYVFTAFNYIHTFLNV